jgi:formamidopyrimidine-DNA glycosylase
MPELPEVETVARGLRASLIGSTVTKVIIQWPGSIGAPDPSSFVQRLTGRTVTGVGRRGKWITVDLNDGQVLLVHLRMTGQLLLECTECPEEKERERSYTRVVLCLDDSLPTDCPETGYAHLRFSDMRKFGRLILIDNPDDVLGQLGPEPLADDFTVERFKGMLAGRRGRIKSLLLNQRFLAGLGNIYVNEALWRAHIHPLRPADTLSPNEVRELYGAIRSLLQAAINEGGTTLANGNFKQANGEAGAFAGHLVVYGREGEPCAGCGIPIERIKVGQRGTYLCTRCQPLSAVE